MPVHELAFKFSSRVAQEFFFCGKRNIAWSSGFGAGKSYTACQKVVALLSKFPGYRVAIGRRSATDLKKTTMQTFYKVCPEELYSEKYGGRRVDAPIPYTELVNKSRIYWVHLDQSDETSLRSLEINSALVDQAEEVNESTYLELDNRVGRWDKVEIPEDLLQLNPNWPRNSFTNAPLAPAYHIVLFNPPDEGEFSYLYQRYHPDSSEWQSRYSKTHHYFQSSSRDNLALPKENLATLLSRDQEWQDRFVEGNFAKGEGAIHNVSPLSYLDVTQEWVNEKLLKKAALMRILDHGVSSPTCCLWAASIGNCYYIYREYYVGNEVVTTHRRNIISLSGDEFYVRNLADPQIFKKESSKNGGFWSVADEYADKSIDMEYNSASLMWQPADNNEFATRNRINELLRIDKSIAHPISGEFGAPRLYFLRRSEVYPNGCYHVIRETVSQKKKLLAEINGKKVYCDDREEGANFSDHAYDPLRYFVASHLNGTVQFKPKPKPGSFMAMQNRIKAMKQLSEGMGAV